MALTTEENDFYTQVGAGTPGGELLRRYWHPIAGIAELAAAPRKRVKLLGEELVLFRDANGALGLIEERCPHRSCSLFYGVPEPGGLRCPYHGWLFDLSGQCLETPAEPNYSRFAEKVKINGYPVKELGGLIFAYIGPGPAPMLPPWDLFVEPGHVIRQIGYVILPCNWFQIMENSVDPYHTDWLHGYFFRHVLAQKEGNSSVPSHFAKSVKVRFEPDEFGIRKFRIRADGSEQDHDWQIGHPLVFPNYLKLGGPAGRRTFQIRVPMDDSHTLHYFYDALAMPDDDNLEVQDLIPCTEIHYTDDSGEFILDDVRFQDFMAWITQGPITNRTQELLGSSDRGVRLFRELYKDQVRLVQEGADPICTFRDEDISTINVPVGNDINMAKEDAAEYWSAVGLRGGAADGAIEKVVEKHLQSSDR